MERELRELRAVGASGSCPRFGAWVSLSFGESVRLELRVSCRVEASRVLICFKGPERPTRRPRREDCFMRARHAAPPHNGNATMAIYSCFVLYRAATTRIQRRFQFTDRCYCSRAG